MATKEYIKRDPLDKPDHPLADIHYKAFNSWRGYTSSFEVFEPTEVMIKEAYSTHIKYFQSAINSGKYRALYEELKKEQADNGQGLALDPMIKELLAKIQNEGNLWAYAKKADKMPLTGIEKDQILSNWKGIQDSLHAMNWSGASKELEKFDQMIAALDAKIASSGFKMSEIIQTKKGTAGSIAGSMQGTLNSLRGVVLEQAAANFLNSKHPTMAFFRTGDIKVNGKSIKEDLLAAFNSLEIKNDKGQVVYKFKDGQIYDATGKVAETVILTEAQYQSLINNVAGGFSAKTSITDIKFHGGKNINTMINEALAHGGNKPSLWQLYHMYQIGAGHNINIYQRYAVSLIAAEVIGKANVFLVSRDKIIPTFEYLNKLFNQYGGFRLSGGALIPRSENALLNKPSSFGSADIVGKY